MFFIYHYASYISSLPHTHPHTAPVTLTNPVKPIHPTQSISSITFTNSISPINQPYHTGVVPHLSHFPTPITPPFQPHHRLSSLIVPIACPTNLAPPPSPLAPPQFRQSSTAYSSHLLHYPHQPPHPFTTDSSCLLLPTQLATCDDDEPFIVTHHMRTTYPSYRLPASLTCIGRPACSI